MDITTLRIVTTLASFACFIGIVAWVYLRRNVKGFESAAQLPFEQD